MIYLDQASTTPVDERVLDELLCMLIINNCKIKSYE
jgi:hypothetical protein